MKEQPIFNIRPPTELSGNLFSTPYQLEMY